MSLDIGEAIQDGFNRTIQKNGLMITGLFFITGLFGTVLDHTMNKTVQSGSLFGQTPTALALPISPTVAGVLTIPLAILSVIIGITGVRTFVSDETDSIPSEFYKRNIGMAFLNMVIGGIFFAIIVFIGLIFLIIPGIYLLVALYFWSVFVAVEDMNFIEALQESWEFTKGNRGLLFLLGLLVLIISALIGAVFAIPSLIGLEGVAAVISQIGSAFASAFGLATVAQVYRQLRKE